MTTLEDIYTANGSWIQDWLLYGGVAPSGDEVLDRLHVTEIINQYGQLDPTDSDYVKNPQFADLYLATEEELQKMDPGPWSKMDTIRRILDRPTTECEELLTLHSDTVGLRIFNIFVKKDATNYIYDRERGRIQFFFNSKQLIPRDRDTLLKIINDFEVAHKRFIDRVHKERLFYEQAASGKPPHKIVTPEDWAEAIVELQYDTLQFQRILEDNIKLYISPERLAEYCDKTTYDFCSYPCTKQPNVLRRGGKCIHKR